VRTLVIGIPLPNASFDNYSFASAPSLSEYRRLVVEMSAVARVVDEIIHATAEHRTFGGQPVTNGPGADNRFSLAELLSMRRREAARFFARDGTAVCIAYPEVTLLGVDALQEWHSYEWLPEPNRFSYSSALLPGFAKDAAAPATAEHPFHAYLQEFAATSRYRTCADDATIDAAGGVVLARSAGGVPVAFDLPLGNGRIVFIPPLLDPAKERQQIADALLAGFEEVSTEQSAEVPDWIRKEVP